MTARQLAEILRRMRSEVAAVLGDELDSVLLYGSQARGDARADSDIDVMIVLRGPFDPADIRRRTAHIASRLSLEYDTVISRAFATREQFEQEMSPFMLNVRDEAMPI
jgi:predicted nucleotidyltransferase